MGQSREGFVYRAISLFNMLEPRIRKESDFSQFKRETRTWVVSKIRVKPKTSFPSIQQGSFIQRGMEKQVTGEEKGEKNKQRKNTI